MNPANSFTAGLRRVIRTPALACWIYLALIVLAFPLTAVMRNVLRESIGSSLVHQSLRQGFDLDWFGEFAAGHSGLAKTFGPGVVGILPMLGNLEKLLDGFVMKTDGTILTAGIFFLLVWAFFGGGVIRRYARPEEPFDRYVLFANSARYFFRFLRLLVLSVAVYLAAARWLAAPLFSWVERTTRDVTVEKTAMLYTVLVYAVFALVLIFVSMGLDYARIAVVTDERKSALLAFVRGVGFILSRPVRCGGLYLALLTVGALWLFAYGTIAPGPNQSTYSGVILTFAAAQIFLMGRLILKLWFLASQTLLYRRSTEDLQPQTDAGAR
jgi:hypothetical protein